MKTPLTSPDQIAIYTTPDGAAHVGELPHKSDMEIAKNYLLEDQARQMRRLATMFLDCAEDQAERMLKRGEDSVD